MHIGIDDDFLINACYHTQLKAFPGFEELRHWFWSIQIPARLAHKVQMAPFEDLQ